MKSSRDRALGADPKPSQPNVITASVTIGAKDYVNLVQFPGSGATTVTLPAVGDADAYDQIYDFVVHEGTGGTAVVIQDQDDGIGAANFTSSNITAAGGVCSVKNMAGKRWMQLAFSAT